MAKNITSLQLLRNTTQLFASREAAYAELMATNPPSGTMDGTPVLARYKGADNKIYTLVGYYAKADAFAGETTGNTYMTVFDFEGQAGDVQKLREEINAKLGNGVTSANTATAQFTALSGESTDSSATTSVWGAKNYAEDLVKTLDYTLAKNDNKVVVSLNQTDGKISGTSVNITSVKLADYAEGTDADIAATDTLGQALGKLQAQINAMDLTVVSGNGEVITSVAEEDGKVSATTTAVKDVKLTGYAKTTASGAIAATDDIEDALSKLENNATANKITNADGSINVTTATTGTDINVSIKDGEHVIMKGGGNGLYTDLKLNKITTGLPTTVKERYQLLGSDDTKLGEVDIDIPKDSHIVSITYITDSGDTHYQNLEYVYIDASGNTQTTYVDMSSMVLEVEFASGVTVTNHVAHGVVDPNSEEVVVDYDSEGNPHGTEKVLAVDANGFKVSNIQTAINAKVNSAISLLDASVTGGTTGGTGHVQVVVDEVDGKLTAVTVTEANIADEDKLIELSAKTFTVATSSNASITTAVTAASDGTKSVDLITDASKIQMSGFTGASVLSGITQASAVTEAFSEVERVIEENEETVAAALTDLDTRLVAEVTARKAVDGQSGESYVAHSGKKYISGATSLDDADVKLNDAIESITTGWIEGVQVNGKDLPESSNKVNVQITASQNAGTATQNEAIVITQDDTTGALTLALATLDVGTY